MRQQLHRIGIIGDDLGKHRRFLRLHGLIGDLVFRCRDKLFAFTIGFRTRLSLGIAAPVLSFRRISTEKAKNRDLFAALPQPGGDAVRQRSAQGISNEMIRTARLELADGFKVPLARLVKCRTGGDDTVRTRRLQSDHGQAGREIPGKAVILPGKALGRMETEQRIAFSAAQVKHDSETGAAHVTGFSRQQHGGRSVGICPACSS